MASYDEEMGQQKQVAGLHRALAHAADMNRDGKISPAELQEFTRYIVGQALDASTVDQFKAGRENGSADFMHGAAGFDDGVDPYEGKKSRAALARKVVGDYVGQLWDNGQLDDDGYITHMQNAGTKIPPGVDDPKELAMMMYQQANGMPDPAAAPAEEEGGMPPVLGLSPDDVAEFQKRAPRLRR